MILAIGKDIDSQINKIIKSTPDNHNVCLLRTLLFLKEILF